MTAAVYRFLLLLATLATASSFCTKSSHNSSSRPKCFYFFEISLKFQDAEEFCRDLGGNLASVTNAFESQIVVDFAFSKGVETFYIGGKASDNPDEYLWTDGTPFKYMRWDSGQPDRSSDCVATVRNGKWTTVPCTDYLPFACISDLVETPTTTTMVTTTTATMTTTTTLTTTTTTNVPTQSLSCSTVTPSHEGPCDPGWVYNSFTSSCYYVSSEQHSTWSDAEHFCVQHNAHLVSIHSDRENVLVAALSMDGYNAADSSQVWIGLSKNNGFREWYWSDGTPLDYTNWSFDERHNKESCGLLMADHEKSHKTDEYQQWKQINCRDVVRAAACKKRPSR